MDFSTVIQLIRELGFPIVCCWLLWKNNTDTMKEVSASLNKNTVVLEKILTKLDIHDVEGVQHEDN